MTICIKEMSLIPTNVPFVKLKRIALTPRPFGSVFQDGSLHIYVFCFCFVVVCFFSITDKLIVSGVKDNVVTGKYCPNDADGKGLHIEMFKIYARFLFVVVFKKFDKEQLQRNDSGY